MPATTSRPFLASPSNHHGSRTKTSRDLVATCLRRHTEGMKKQVAGAAPKHWAKFDDATLYGISDKQEKILWQREVDRLIQTAERSSPILFEGSGVMGSGIRTVFSDVSDVADQLLCALIVCQHDTETLLREHFEELYALDTYERVHSIVVDRLMPENPERHPRKLEKDNTKIYRALVDYISALVAQLFMRSINSERLQTLCIATLARWCVKAKILEIDVLSSASISLGNARSVHSKIESLERFQQHRARLHDQDDQERLRALGQQSLRMKFEPEKDRHRRTYYLETDFVNKVVLAMIQRVLINLKGNSNPLTGTTSSVDKFAVSTLVYGAGFLSHPTLVTQYRDGEVAASSHGVCLSVCFNALRMLADICQSLVDTHQVLDPPGSPEPAWHFTWRLEEIDQFPRLTGYISSSNPDAAVSVLSMLICCSADMADLMASMSSLAVIDENFDVGAESHADPKYEAKAVFKTAAYHASNPAAQFVDQRQETVPLHESALAREDLLHAQHFKPKPGQPLLRAPTMDSQKSTAIKHGREEMRELERRIQKEWVIDEASISIGCGPYVLPILTLCFMLVAGGMAVGFSVGDRIHGVDPFNIATFSWVLAGFIILVAKAMLVESWSWRDFFKRRCVCRSVSELSSVTLVSRQRIITYLLHNEASTILRTKGPYNAPFVNIDPNGFAVDVKASLRTLLLSGIIMLKVGTLKGPALVALRVRKNLRYVSIDSWNLPDPEHLDLVCLDIQNLPYPDEESRENRDMVLRWTQLRWHNIIGVYNALEREFR